MAIRDIKSDLTTIYSDLIVVPSGSAIFSSSINIKDYDDGIMLLAVPISSDTEGNLISLNSIQDSKDDTVWSDIDNSQYIGDLTSLQGIEVYNPPLVIATLGVFGTDQYIRVSLNSDVSNTGDMVLQIIWLIKGEVRPDPTNPLIHPVLFDVLLTNDDDNLLTNDDDQLIVDG